MSSTEKTIWSPADFSTKSDAIAFWNAHYKSPREVHCAKGTVSACWERIAELFTREEFENLLKLGVFYSELSEEARHRHNNAYPWVPYEKYLEDIMLYYYDKNSKSSSGENDG